MELALPMEMAPLWRVSPLMAAILARELCINCIRCPKERSHKKSQEIIWLDGLIGLYPNRGFFYGKGERSSEP